jgi:hypothetical protein
VFGQPNTLRRVWGSPGMAARARRPGPHGRGDNTDPRRVNLSCQPRVAQAAARPREDAKRRETPSRGVAPKSPIYLHKWFTTGTNEHHRKHFPSPCQGEGRRFESGRPLYLYRRFRRPEAVFGSGPLTAFYRSRPPRYPRFVVWLWSGAERAKACSSQESLDAGEILDHCRRSNARAKAGTSQVARDYRRENYTS